MATQPKQLHVGLSEEDDQKLRRIAEIETRTVSDTIRHLIRRAAAALGLPA